MGKPGILNIAIGVILLAAGYFLRNQIGDLIFYIVMAAGLLALAFGLMKFFQDRGKSDDDRHEENKALRNEVLLKTLARMTYADTNIKPVEVEAVKKIYKKATGENITGAKIRVTARGDIHESKEFCKYLTGVRSSISTEDKCFIIKAMAEVIKVDGSVSPGEVSFFDEVGTAFKMNPSEIADLKK